MKQNTITRRQFSAAIFVGLLSPLIRLLPRMSVQLAGQAAFFSVIPAFFVLWALAALIAAYRKYMQPGEGLAQLLFRWLGPVFGRIILSLFALFFLFYAGFILRSGAERLTATVYPASSIEPFMLILLALALLTALGTMRAAARTAVILRAILLAVLALVFVFAVPNAEGKNLLPLALRSGGDLFFGALPIVTVGGMAACFAFLDGYAERPAAPVRWLMPSLILFLIIAALLCVEVVATFGAALTTQIGYPFFMMIRDISILNLAQRIEAVVIALWVFADYILCTLLLRCAHEALRPVFSLPVPEASSLFSFSRGRWLLWLEAGLALLFGFLVAPTSYRLLAWSDKIVPILGDSLVYGVLPLIWLLTRSRRCRELPGE